VIRRKDAQTYAFIAGKSENEVNAYSVESMVPAFDLKERPRAWGEPPHNFGWNCRTVPTVARTPQLRELAFRITMDANTPIEKADAIRDYLRKNYKYNAEAPNIPGEEEAVNYFLFKSKEGSCRHFAQALVLLARLNGLYARLVTGYSPGNYNMLTNCFEIYQYHAHAWAQVFIEPYGWLTYDGVAPGNLRIGDNNRRLQNLFDPFGDTWKSKTPELSPDNFGKTPEQAAREIAEAETLSQKLYEKNDMMSRIEERAQKGTMGQEPDAVAFAKAAISVGLEKLGELWGRAVKLTDEFWHSVKEWLRWGAIRFLCLKEKWYVILVSLGGLLLLAWFGRRTLRRWIHSGIGSLKCAWLWHRACATRRDSPSLCIEYCQRHNGILLAMRYRHIPNGDVVECGSVIKEAEARRDYVNVAEAAQRVWYSAHRIDSRLAEMALAATRRFKKQLRG